jgi:P pilus assembly chaperone PapD
MVVILLLTLTHLVKANVRVSPTLLFVDEPRRSTSFEVLNVTDKEIEVWLEVKYGYVTSDDTNNIYIKTPDVFSVDDQPMDEWTSLYPNRFLLKPSEKRYVRVIAAPPLTLNDKEYWTRISIFSKPSKATPKLLTDKQEQAQVGLEIVNQQSIPIHYRKGKVSTSVDIIDKPDIRISNKELIYTAKYQRFGNSSYWGRMHFELVDSKGKVVKKHDQNLVIYKQITIISKIDISGIPNGAYTLKAVAEAKRIDDASKFVIKSEPKTWKYNVTTE